MIQVIFKGYRNLEDFFKFYLALKCMNIFLNHQSRFNQNLLPLEVAQQALKHILPIRAISHLVARCTPHSNHTQRNLLVDITPTRNSD